MAYDEKLAGRVRSMVAGMEGVTERRMFGGLLFMLGGNIFLGIRGEDLMVRVGPDAYDEALARPHARRTSRWWRPMKGYVFIGPEGCAADEDLASWVNQAAEFARGLPRSGRRGG